jgi:phenylalanyl-tRNA synthetase alpha chain
MQKGTDIDSIILELSPIEKSILPYLHLKDIVKISRESKQPDVAVKRALEFLSNKSLVTLESKSKKIVALNTNGILYLKHELPERRLLNFLAKNKKISLKDAKEKSKLEDEFGIALGTLKGKAFISLENNLIILTAKESEIEKKFPEEKFLSELPLDLDNLNSEQKFCLEKLKSRKEMIKIEDFNDLSFNLTAKGNELLKNLGKVKQLKVVESLTPEMLRTGEWKNKVFRKYDIGSRVPAISGGKRQPYNEFLKEVRENLISLGFEEAKGPLVETSFFNCDALFMPQNHPARGIHDLYFVKGKGDLSEYKKAVANVKKMHESGGAGSEGWKVSFSEKESERLVLRSQGTAVSARILAGNPKIPGKYFSIARCFRPDVIDASHHTEFNQLEGIVIDKSVNFRQLLGMLKTFAEKMTGTKKVKFLPGYFPFTEPSVEGYLYHEKLGKWIEVLPAGVFRPELTAPLGIKENVLAWGIGIDRLYMIRENINDIRQIFSSDLEWLRKSKKENKNASN